MNHLCDCTNVQMTHQIELLVFDISRRWEGALDDDALDILQRAAANEHSAKWVVAAIRLNKCAIGSATPRISKCWLIPFRKIG